jgi:hypothetical protein
MTYKSLLAMPAMVLVLGIGAALAAPGGNMTGLATAGGEDSLVHKTHGCHR